MQLVPHGAYFDWVLHLMAVRALPWLHGRGWGVRVQNSMNRFCIFVMVLGLCWLKHSRLLDSETPCDSMSGLLKNRAWQQLTLSSMNSFLQGQLVVLHWHAMGRVVDTWPLCWVVELVWFASWNLHAQWMYFGDIWTNMLHSSFRLASDQSTKLIY